MTRRLFALALGIAALLDRADCLAQAATCAYVLRRGEEADPPSGAVIVLDTATNTQTVVIPIGGPFDTLPRRIALAPDGTRAYVTFESSEAEGVAVIDTATNTVIDTLRGQVGCGVAVGPDSQVAYAGSDGGDLAVIDTVSNQIVGNVPSAGGCDVRVSQNGRTVFALDADQVKVIDPAERKIVRSLPLRLSSESAAARALALPPGNLLYVGEDGGIVYVVEIPNNAVAVGIASACDRNRGVLYDVAATRDGRLVYATHLYGEGDGCITVISASSQRASLSIPVESGATAVATTPDNARAYVGTGGAEDIALYVINVPTSTIVDTLPLPGCADGASRCFVEDIAIGMVPEGCSAQPPTPTIPTPTPTETRTPAPTSTPGRCFGDCDSDGHVAVDEIVYGVGIALGTRPLNPCPSADGDNDGAVRIDDLVRAVNAAIVGCVAPLNAHARW